MNESITPIFRRKEQKIVIKRPLVFEDSSITQNEVVTATPVFTSQQETSPSNSREKVPIHIINQHLIWTGNGTNRDKEFMCNYPNCTRKGHCFTKCKAQRHIREKHFGEKRKRNRVPKGVKDKSWDIYIGADKGTGPCFCCKKIIDSKNFEAGHVIAKAKGGKNHIDNIRPICGNCNRSMGTMNMYKYIELIQSKKKDIQMI